MASLNGLNPEFRRRLEELMRAVPGLYVYSGYRSPIRQAALYAQAVAKYGPRNARKYVAPPGRSNHGRGEAADMAPRSLLDDAARVMGRYGLYRPMSYEPWHFERNDLRSNPGAYTTPSDRPVANPIPAIPLEDNELNEAERKLLSDTRTEVGNIQRELTELDRSDIFHKINVKIDGMRADLKRLEEKIDKK